MIKNHLRSRKILFNKEKSNTHHLNFKKSLSNSMRILGVILFSIGILFFIYPLYINYRLGLLLILIGAFLLFFISDKSTNVDLDRNITFLLIFWLLVMFYMTVGWGVDIFFFSIVLGMIIIKELIDEWLSTQIRKKMIILNSMFFIIFMIFMAEKIINYVNI
jgi:hypothetical protein